MRGDRIRLTPYRQWLADAGHCLSDNDGECEWKDCPQIRDDEPTRSGRHCPRDNNRSDDEG